MVLLGFPLSSLFSCEALKCPWLGIKMMIDNVFFFHMMNNNQDGFLCNTRATMKQQCSLLNTIIYLLLKILQHKDIVFVRGTSTYH